MDARNALGLVLIAIGASWWLVRRAPPAPPLDPPAMLAQVRQLNQLASIQYTVQKVVAIREQKQPVGSESILLILQASVEARPRSGGPASGRCLRGLEWRHCDPASARAMEETRQAALEMGILRQAETNAMTSIRGLLGLVGVKTVIYIPGSAS